MPEDASLAAAIFATDPVGIGGVVLRARAGAPRDRWLEIMTALLPEGVRPRRVPPHVTDDRLLGGLDLAATLAGGKPIAERGLLAASHGAVLLLPMAERLSAGLAARISSALDRHEIRVERDGFAHTLPAAFGVVALDEGIEEDERPPAALLDRLACHLDLGDSRAEDIDRGISREDAAQARLLLPRVALSENAVEALCAASIALGISSLNVPFLATRVAKAAASLDAIAEAREEHIALAARLVLAPRATRLPMTMEEDPADPPRQEAEEKDESEDRGRSREQLQELVLAAAAAAIPEGLLAKLHDGAASRARSRGSSRAGDAKAPSLGRGRQTGTMRAPPRGGARLHLVETLRAAAPWQVLRRRQRAVDLPRRLDIRTEDFRMKRLKHRRGSVTLFVVDASGSAALARLAEAKGAVELLLADCYVRRDQVALLAFGGRGVELLLPPTRSLARAKRSLADLPGGGGTPLAAALDQAAALALAIRRKGQVPAIVVLTDGRPNLARDGGAGRGPAEADAIAAARGLRAASFQSLLIDTSAKSEPTAARIAAAMGAGYVPLPHADARKVSDTVRIELARRES